MGATETIAKMPLVWRSVPSNESSPRNTALEGRESTYPELSSMPTAMGRS